jgi:hypothetical protein
MTIRKVLGQSRAAKCSICEVVGHRNLFDVDHKIPRCIQGPDEPWNLWPLCLNHHRLKSLMERHWIPKHEKRCFCCNRVVSKYFYHHFWCTSCKGIRFDIRVQKLEENIQFEIEQYLQKI